MPSEFRLKVTSVDPAGSAEAVGLRAGDILEEFNGVKLGSTEELNMAIAKNTGGAVLTLHRNGERLELAMPPGRMGIIVARVDFDPDVYFAQEELEQRVRGMIVCTTPSIEGYRITRTIDVVTAECVFGLNIFKDFFMGLTDFFGGRSDTAQSALRDARLSCLNELKREAASVGGNAVVGVDLDYSEFSGKGNSMLFLVASGTAVTIEKV